MAVKNKIKEIIDSRGIKQTWLAEKAKIDRSTLNSVISNKKSTNLETGMRIAKALDKTVEEVFEIIDNE